MAKFLYMMIGISGSGKSTLAKELADQSKADVVKIFSSDEIREKVFGDAQDQTHNKEVFAILHKEIHNFFPIDNDGKNYLAIYDATNLNAKKRSAFLNTLPKDVHAIAQVVATPISIAEQNSLNRVERVVPVEVILNQAKRFQFPTYGEGFAGINIYYPFMNRELINLRDELYVLKDEPHDNPHYSLTISDHMFAAADLMDKYLDRFKMSKWAQDNIDIQDELAALVAAKYHDVGKFMTKQFCDIHGNKTEIAHYYGHDNLSAYLWITSVECYRYWSKQWYWVSIEAAQLIQYHMMYWLAKTDKSLRKLKKRIKFEKTYKLLRMLNKCDKEAH